MVEGQQLINQINQQQQLLQKKKTEMESQRGQRSIQDLNALLKRQQEQRRLSDINQQLLAARSQIEEAMRPAENRADTLRNIIASGVRRGGKGISGALRGLSKQEQNFVKETVGELLERQERAEKRLSDFQKSKALQDFYKSLPEGGMSVLNPKFVDPSGAAAGSQLPEFKIGRVAPSLVSSQAPNVVVPASVAANFRDQLTLFNPQRFSIAQDVDTTINELSRRSIQGLRNRGLNRSADILARPAPFNLRPSDIINPQAVFFAPAFGAASFAEVAEQQLAPRKKKKITKEEIKDLEDTIRNAFLSDEGRARLREKLRELISKNAGNTKAQKDIQKLIENALGKETGGTFYRDLAIQEGAAQPRGMQPINLAPVKDPNVLSPAPKPRKRPVEPNFDFFTAIPTQISPAQAAGAFTGLGLYERTNEVGAVTPRSGNRVQERYSLIFPPRIRQDTPQRFSPFQPLGNPSVLGQPQFPKTPQSPRISPRQFTPPAFAQPQSPVQPTPQIFGQPQTPKPRPRSGTPQQPMRLPRRIGTPDIFGGRGRARRQIGFIPRSRFDIFVRRRKKDIKIGSASTERGAKDILFGRLRSTLGASGFIQSGSTRLRAPSTREFRPAVRDPFRIVQRRGFRLSTFGERREIKASRRRR